MGPDENTRLLSKTTLAVALIALVGTACTVTGSMVAAKMAVSATKDNVDKSSGDTKHQIEQSSADLNGQLASLKSQLRSSLTSVDAAEVLSFDEPTKGHPLITGATTHISGKLKQDLPNGVQIWVGSNFVAHKTSVTPDSSFGVEEAGPCPVDLSARTFDCGDVTLGNKGQSGKFAVYVGLADSGEARSMTKLITEQLANEWKGAPPPGMKWLPPLLKIRPKT